MRAHLERDDCLAGSATCCVNRGRAHSEWADYLAPGIAACSGVRDRANSECMPIRSMWLFRTHTCLEQANHLALWSAVCSFTENHRMAACSASQNCSSDRLHYLDIFSCDQQLCRLIGWSTKLFHPLATTVFALGDWHLLAQTHTRFCGQVGHEPNDNWSTVHANW